jgi:hypothetical protein
MAETKGSTDRRESFLGSAAYADTKHDFGHGKFKVKLLDKVLNQREMYNKGLFGESNKDFKPLNYKDEDTLLNSLLSEPASPQDSRSSKTLTLDDILTNIIKKGNQEITINVTGKPIQYNVKGIVGKIINVVKLTHNVVVFQRRPDLNLTNLSSLSERVLKGNQE